MRFNLSKKSLIIIGVIIIAVIAVVGIQRVLASRDGKLSDEQIKVGNTAINGWSLKNYARLDVNKDKVRQIKQKLMDFYDADSGELAEQQRLIDGLIAADNASDKKSLDTNTPMKLLNFRITNVKLEKINVDGSSADVTADIQYYIKYDAQHQDYSTYGENTYQWKLKNKKGKWKIVTEDVVKGDDQS